MIFYILLSLAAGLCGPFNSILIKHIINMLPGVNASNLSVLILPASLIIVNFIVFDNFTWRGLSYIRAIFVPLILNRMVGELMDQCLRKSHQFYQDN